MSQPAAGPSTAPAEVHRLAEQRAAARAAADYAASDRLRDQIGALGWTVRDTSDGAVLTPRPPYDVADTLAELRSPVRSGAGATVGLLVDGWPQDVRTCVDALVAHAPADVSIVLLEQGQTDAGEVVHELVRQHPERVHELHVARAGGWSAARQALIDLDPADVHVLMDVSTVLEGDALSPILTCFADPTVVGAGWRGVAVVDGWLDFAPSGPGEVEALLGYLFAVRRSAALAVPLPPKARFYRNADMEWSFLLREAGGRLVVPEGDLPVRQDRHHGYHDTDPVVRDRESRKTYDRFLQRFRGREDLRLR